MYLGSDEPRSQLTDSGARRPDSTRHFHCMTDSFPIVWGHCNHREEKSARPSQAPPSPACEGEAVAQFHHPYYSKDLENSRHPLALHRNNLEPRSPVPKAGSRRDLSSKFPFFFSCCLHWLDFLPPWRPSLPLKRLLFGKSCGTGGEGSGMYVRIRLHDP